MTILTRPRIDIRIKSLSAQDHALTRRFNLAWRNAGEIIGKRSPVILWTANSLGFEGEALCLVEDKPLNSFL
jgi:hypothetical protein